MKKLVFLTIVSLFIAGSAVSAQMGMNRFSNKNSDHTKKEEAEGKQIWQKLQGKKINCQKLTDDQFEALGEYFMGQMMGEAHPAMNQMMTAMMGEKGEKQTHINMGKKLSGCFGGNINSFNFMPMMGMMGSFGNPMMGWGTRGWFGFLYWGLVQILVLVILVLLVVYLLKKVKS